ncbi:MAG TPA: hypothetical protein VLC49_02590 [Solirubrobacteraceae bacterium]|nr:hypothetical protein [Solirubrobacteraceae bacterium]
MVALLGAAVVLPSAAAAASPTAATTAAPATTPVTPSLGGQGSNPLSPGFPQPSVSIPTTTTAVPTVSGTTSAGSGSGLTGNSAVIIAIGAIIVLGGISFYIWRDARRRAPVRAHAAGPIDEGRRAGSKAKPKSRKLSPAERKRRKRGRAR